MCFQVPQRTTSISPALVRKNSPGNGPGLGPRAGAHLIRARYTNRTRVDVVNIVITEMTSLVSSWLSNDNIGFIYSVLLV